MAESFKSPRGLLLAVALPALALGLALGLARLWQAHCNRPLRLSYAIQTLERELPALCQNSLHLQKGRVVALDEGAPERWRCLMRLQGGQATLVKPVRRLARGRAMRLMLGKSAKPDPIWLPQACLALRLIEAQATGYDAGPVSPGRGEVGRTSIGERARFGIIAVDPRIIPYRSRLYVAGYGPGLAADTGGAIKGARLDLCFDSTREARAWGRKRVRAWVLSALPKARRQRVLKAAGLGGG
jgi:3D (Asp-Asp-Asp) domain-containing protein